MSSFFVWWVSFVGFFILLFLCLYALSIEGLWSCLNLCGTALRSFHHALSRGFGVGNLLGLVPFCHL